MGEDTEFSLELKRLESTKKEYEAGCLSIFKNLTKEECEIYFKQLSDKVSYKLDILRNIIDDDILFIKVLDIFAGESLNFPNRKQTFQYLDKACMYSFTKKRNFSEESFKLVSKNFDEKLACAKSKILRISSLLDGAEYESLVKAQNKLKKQKLEKKQQKLNELNRGNHEN